jgi:hypothetical protein
MVQALQERLVSIGEQDGERQGSNQNDSEGNGDK